MGGGEEREKEKEMEGRRKGRRRINMVVRSTSSTWREGSLVQLNETCKKRRGRGRGDQKWMSLVFGGHETR